MHMAAGDEEPKFRCLHAARYAVASAVTVLILVVIVYAVVTVLRPGDLTLEVLSGYVSVERNTSIPAQLTFLFNVRAINPSGRIRIYYTGILCTFSGQMNKSAKAEDFLIFPLPDITVEQQNSQDTTALVFGCPSTMPQQYFNWFFNGSTIPDAMLKLTGTRIVENYSGHNMTSRNDTIYYCPSITAGGEHPETPADVQCTENLPASASS